MSRIDHLKEMIEYYQESYERLKALYHEQLVDGNYQAIKETRIAIEQREQSLKMLRDNLERSKHNG